MGYVDKLGNAVVVVVPLANEAEPELLPGSISVVTVVANVLVPFGPMLVVNTVVVVGIGDSVDEEDGEAVDTVDKCVDVEDGMGSVSEPERFTNA